MKTWDQGFWAIVTFIKHNSKPSNILKDLTTFIIGEKSWISRQNNIVLDKVLGGLGTIIAMKYCGSQGSSLQMSELYNSQVSFSSNVETLTSQSQIARHLELLYKEISPGRLRQKKEG